MIQRDPKKRMDAKSYLDNWKTLAFAPQFYSYLHKYGHYFCDSGFSPDDKANQIQRQLPNILTILTDSAPF
eukprot:Pgem_evm1s17653